MKVSRFLRAAALIGVGLALAACTSMAGSGSGTTPATLQIALSPAAAAKIFCLPVQTAVAQGKAILAATPASDATATKISAAMKIASPLIDATCAAGATVTATNIQDFNTQAIPALASIIPLLPITDVQKQQAQAILLSAATTVALVNGIETNLQAAKASATSTPASSPAAAPASAASTPLSASAAFTLGAVKS